MSLDGASLIYTSNSAPNSLPTLIHSSLGIHSLLKKQALKHNVIDRDKILIPSNWDSWGKIRVLREGFDVEGTSSGWSVDIQTPPLSSINGSIDADGIDSTRSTSQLAQSSPEGAVLPDYESTIPNPRKSRSSKQSNKPRIELSVKPNQDFLAAQLETLTRLQAEEEKSASKRPTTTTATPFSTKQPTDRVNEHIGPVQVNMGGIQVDADDMLKKLKNRERDNASSKTPEPEATAGVMAAQTPEEQKRENEKLNAFFANLAKRGASGSPKGTPGREGRVASGKETPSKKA